MRFLYVLPYVICSGHYRNIQQQMPEERTKDKEQYQEERECSTDASYYFEDVIMSIKHFNLCVLRILCIAFHS